jgi:hypothetical protein
MRAAAERERMARELARLLACAREDLADAALLAANGRRNAALLTEQAMRHALQAVSLSEGLDVAAGQPISTLLRRVPPDHLLAREIAEAGPEPSLERAGRLVAALADAFGTDAGRPDAPAAHAEPLRAPPEDNAPVQAGRRDREAPTALSSSARFAAERAQTERAKDREDSYPGAAFWALADRWQVPDLEALALIGHEGGLTRSGTRPRFRLHGVEAQRFAGLQAIDAALAAMGVDPVSWLTERQHGEPYGGKTPLQVLTETGTEGATAVHHQLTHEGLSRALAQTGRAATQGSSARRKRRP